MNEFTVEELEVIYYVIEGYDILHIALKMGKSRGAVYQRLRGVYRKTGFESVTGRNKFPKLKKLLLEQKFLSA